MIHKLKVNDWVKLKECYREFHRGAIGRVTHVFRVRGQAKAAEVRFAGGTCVPLSVHKIRKWSPSH